MASQYIPWDILTVSAAFAVLVAVAAAVPGLRAHDHTRALRAAARVLAVGSFVAILTVTATNGDATGRANLRPGNGIGDSLSNVNQQLGLINVLGNVVMFVPLGLFLLLALSVRWRTATVLCALASLCIEILQFTLGRAADIDDVLLNTVGGAAGALLGVALMRWFAPPVSVAKAHDVSSGSRR